MRPLSIILAICLIISLIAILIIIIVQPDKHTVIGKCYDKFNSEIIGQTCLVNEGVGTQERIIAIMLIFSVILFSVHLLRVMELMHE